MLAVLAVVEFVAAGLDEKLGETPDIGGVIPLRVGWPASAGSRGRAKWPSLMSICGVLSTRGLRGQDPHAAPSLCLEIFLPRQRRLGYRTTGKRLSCSLLLRKQSVKFVGKRNCLQGNVAGVGRSGDAAGRAQKGTAG